MIKVVSITQVEDLVEVYFKILKSMPEVGSPKYPISFFAKMRKVELNDDDKEELSVRFSPSSKNISDYYYLDEFVMNKISSVAYRVLGARYRERPVPWKVLEYRFGYSRQMLDNFRKKALQEIFDRLS